MISDKELIQILQQEYEKTGIIPQKKLIAESEAIISRFGTWNKALRIAGIIKVPQKEEIFELLKNWEMKNGKPPTKYELNAAKAAGEISYSVQSICKSLGLSWEEILEEAGISQTKRFKDMSDKEILNLVKQELVRLNTIRGNHYNKNKKPTMPSLSYLNIRFGTWVNVIDLLDMGEGNKKYSKEDVLKLIKKLTEEGNKTPTIKDLNQHGCRTNNIVRYFGSYANALKQLGIEPNIKREEGKLGRRKNTKVFTKKEIVELIKNTYIETNKVPTIKELNLKGCSTNNIVRNFGTYSEAVKFAGLEPNKYSKKIG